MADEFQYDFEGARKARQFRERMSGTPKNRAALARMEEASQEIEAELEKKRVQLNKRPKSQVDKMMAFLYKAKDDLPSLPSDQDIPEEQLQPEGVLDVDWSPEQKRMARMIGQKHARKDHLEHMEPAEEYPMDTQLDPLDWAVNGTTAQLPVRREPSKRAEMSVEQTEKWLANESKWRQQQDRSEQRPNHPSILPANIRRGKVPEAKDKREWVRVSDRMGAAKKKEHHAWLAENKPQAWWQHEDEYGDEEFPPFKAQVKRKQAAREAQRNGEAAENEPQAKRASRMAAAVEPEPLERSSRARGPSRKVTDNKAEAFTSPQQPTSEPFGRSTGAAPHQSLKYGERDAYLAKREGWPEPQESSMRSTLPGNAISPARIPHPTAAALPMMESPAPANMTRWTRGPAMLAPAPALERTNTGPIDDLFSNVVECNIPRQPDSGASNTSSQSRRSCFRSDAGFVGSYSSEQATRDALPGQSPIAPSWSPLTDDGRRPFGESR